MGNSLCATGILPAIPEEAENGLKRGKGGGGFRKQSIEQASILRRKEEKMAVCPQG
jgi:hypothetical protein